MKLIFSIILILGSISVSFAEGGVLSIRQAWARPVILMNRPGAAYFTMQNESGVADKLIKASSSLAERIELHVHRHEGGIMRMEQVTDIPVPAHESTMVKPGGYHLMLFGLKKKLAVGDELPLTLTFFHAGEIKVKAGVMKNAPEMPHDKMQNHQMDHQKMDHSKMNHDMMK